jgi:UPF0755 protein
MTSDSDFDKIFRTLPGQQDASGGQTSVPRRAQRPKNGQGSSGKGLFAGIAAVVLVLTGMGVWLVWNEYGTRIVNYFAEEEVANFEGEGEEPAVEIVISPGDIGQVVAQKLFEAGVTASFESVYSLLLQDSTITFQAGTYRLLTGMSAESAIQALRDPANQVQVRFTIPEGRTLEQALEIIAEKAALPLADLQAAAANPGDYGVDNPAGTLEGYLFPATYTFEPGVEAPEIISRMVNEMQSRLRNLGVPEDQWHEVLTMAGLIQREARFEEDFYKVARVFYNRLDIDMRLQSDATVTYWTGLYGRAGTSDADRADTQNPYNTYQIRGLPPGPISLPGETAIKATLDPAPGTWLYFVSVDLRTGETIFSNTLAEHERARAQWLEWCAASEENGAYC